VYGEEAERIGLVSLCVDDDKLQDKALEIAARGTLRFDVVKGKDIAWPRIENDERIMVIGSAKPMEDAARIAYSQLVNWLMTDYGFDMLDAYQLLTQAGQLYVGNMVTDAIYVYDTATGKVVMALNVGESVRPIVLDEPRGLLYYQLSRLHGFEVRRIADGSFVRRVDLPALDKPVAAADGPLKERLADLRAYLEAVTPPEPPARGSARWLPRPAGDLPTGAAAIAAAGGRVAPLVARGRTLGTLAVGQPESTREMHLLGDLAPRAALALDNALLYAERTAASRALQRSLLPPELPELPGVDVGVVYEASGRGNEVGGDFYDVFALDPFAPGPDLRLGRFAFAVGDVCGKGPEAAAVTGLARTTLRLLGRRGEDIPEVLADLNDALLAEGRRTRFVTLVYGEATPRPDGGLDVRIASAGHPAPVLLHADGTTTPVGRAGDLLGVFEKPETRVDVLRIEPGDTLVCFTDGVTERRDGSTSGRMLGEEGVRAVLAGSQDLDAAGVARRLGRAVADFASTPARDDVAVLALRAVRPRRPEG